jgi:hypothetical protein
VKTGAKTGEAQKVEAKLGEGNLDKALPKRVIITSYEVPSSARLASDYSVVFVKITNESKR